MLFLVLLMYCSTHIMVLHRQGVEELCYNAAEVLWWCCFVVSSLSAVITISYLLILLITLKTCLYIWRLSHRISFACTLYPSFYYSFDFRLSGQWPSWRLLWTSVWGSGRWSRSQGPPYGPCLAPAWLAWRTWATAATSTLSCKCSSPFQTSRASQYPLLLIAPILLVPPVVMLTMLILMADCNYNIAIKLIITAVK